MRFINKSVSILLGITACGISSYLLYLFFREDEEDDFLDNYTKVSKFKTVDIKVPKEMVRELIGRNGKNIKLIQEQSNTKIIFRDCDGVNENFKVCVIKGTDESCNIAQSLIKDFIDNQPVIECEDLWVPISCVGKIIGRGGEKISELRSLSGAKISVSDIMDDEKGFNTKRITMKGTKEQIVVAKSLIEEVVEQALHNQQLVESSLAKREPRHPPKNSESEPLNRLDSPRGERISPIPGQPDAQFEVYVSAMVNPSRFWLQIVGPKATQLDCLVEEMTEYYSKPDNVNLHLLSEVKEGDLVAAIFKYDSKWYRAEVLNIKEENSEKVAELYYVDYGDTDILPCKDLFELRTDFLRLHFQAIECFLARVEPSDGKAWSEEAVDKFEEWTHVAQWKKLSGRINGYSVREKTRAKREGSPVPGIDLYDVSNDQDHDIAEELVKAGCAVYKKEELRSSRTTSISNLSVASSS